MSEPFRISSHGGVGIYLHSDYNSLQIIKLMKSKEHYQ